MKEEFEITLHALRLPGVGYAPVEISPIVADFRLVAPWCDGRRLRWVDWGSRSAAGSGVRGGEAKEEMLLEMLLDERDMEFAAEGKRWYDLLRYGKQQNFKYKARFKAIIMENNLTAENKWLSSVLDNDNAWYLPIPAEDIFNNSLLTQNPYYE